MGNDEFVFGIKKITESVESLEITEGKMLKISATFYDPLGFISPITASVKSILELLCKDKKGWDVSVSEEIRNVWVILIDSLRKLKIDRVKRFCFVEPSVRVTFTDMHGFCGSSKYIYLAVVSLRVKTSVGVRVKFAGGCPSEIPFDTKFRISGMCFVK